MNDATHHELLLADATLQRLGADRVRQHPVRVVTLNRDGELTRDGEAVSLADLNLSLVCMDGELLRTDQALVVQLLMNTPSFEFVQTMAAGLDHPLFQPLVEKTGVFCNSDAQAPAIAEFVVASVLNRWQNFQARQALQSRHQWEEVRFRQILNSHWLIIGYGNIGQRVAKQVKGFGATVTGIRRNLAPHPDADQVVALEDLTSHLPNADAVVLACALNTATEGLAGKSFFNAMKPGSVLVNIGRGELLDESSLLEALDANRLDYAILDVFDKEPLPGDSPLWDHAAIQVTAHASHAGDQTSRRFDELFLHNLTQFLAGGPVRNRVSTDYFGN